MVRHVTEVAQQSERILFIDKKSTLLFDLLKKRFEGYDTLLQRSQTLPSQYARFSRIFFLDDTYDPAVQFPPSIRVTVIHLKQYGKMVSLPSPSSSAVKYVIISTPHLTEDEVTQLIWFSLSRSEETVLDLRKKGPATHETTPKKHKSRVSKRRQIVRYGAVAFFTLITAFVIPLIISLLMSYQLLQTFTNSTTTSKTGNSMVNVFTKATNILYLPARPFYSIFGVSLIPDSVVRLSNNAADFLISAEKLSTTQKTVFSTLNLPKETPYKATLVLKDLDNLDSTNQTYLTHGERLASSIPAINSSALSIQSNLKSSLSTSRKFAQILPLLRKLAQENGTKTVLVLIVDNGKVRGSGGIITSIGLLTLSNGSLDSARFFSSDQLNTAVEQDEIAGFLTASETNESTYLNDASASIDFFETSIKARSQVERLLGVADIHSTILVTTTGLQDLLKAYPDLYLSSKKEKINADNIHIKAQVYQRDPSFVPEIFQLMSQTVGTIQSQTLIHHVLKSLDEKYITILSNDAVSQQIFDALYWAGKTISPKCIVESTSCINDYLFSIDQDLSNRSGSSYIQKTQLKSVQFVDASQMISTVRIRWKNDSPLPNEQGGLYRVYTQLLLPQNSQIEQITKNNVLVEERDELTGKFKIIGIHLDVPSKQTVELAVRYSLPARLRDQTNYQFIVQKQIGSQTGNITFEALLPKDYEISAKNIDPVVNEARIFYNTSLNTDKLFFLELKKKEN